MPLETSVHRTIGLRQPGNGADSEATPPSTLVPCTAGHGKHCLLGIVDGAWTEIVIST